jgi:hypothetical protein
MGAVVPRPLSLVGRLAGVLVAVLLAAPPVAAQVPLELADAVDFSITLKDLDQRLREERFALPDRAFILDGTVKRIEISDEAAETYFVQIELVKGEWFGREEVRSYSSLVLLDGPQFAEFFPPRGAEPTAAAIPVNSRVIVVGVARGIFQMSEAATDLAWVVDALHIRRL